MQRLIYLDNMSRVYNVDLSMQSAVSEVTPDVISNPYFSSSHITLFKGDATSVLSSLDTEFVDGIVTSPPYYGKRDYGVVGQLGLEAHPQTYINNLIEVFREAKRILKPTGVFGQYWRYLLEWQRTITRRGFQRELRFW